MGESLKCKVPNFEFKVEEAFFNLATERKIVKIVFLSAVTVSVLINNVCFFL